MSIASSLVRLRKAQTLIQLALAELAELHVNAVLDGLIAKHRAWQLMDLHA